MVTTDQYAKTKQILKWVLQNPHSDFYKKKYQQFKEKEFNLLPYLLREDIVSTHPLDRLFVSPQDISTWCFSSGTTSKGDFVIVPKLPHPDPALKNYAKLLNQFKIEKLMVLTRLNYQNDKVKEWQANPSISAHRPFIFGDIYNFNVTAKMASVISIDALESTPSILHFFVPFLKENYNLDKIKFICLGGEYTSEQKLKLFKSYFKNAYFHFRFGGTENPIYKGFRCEYISSMPPRFFHPNTDFYLYEILDEDGQNVKVGERGELILTTLQKCAFPLIRYKSGDAVIWHTTKICQCGSKDLIEVFGRIGYDFVRISGLTLHIEMFEKALSQIDPKLITLYQLHVYEEAFKKQLLPKLVLHLLVSKMSKTKKAILMQKIESLFYLSPTMTLKELITKGIMLPLQIELEDAKKISYKSVKIVSHIK